MKKLLLGSLVAVAFILFGATNVAASQDSTVNLISSSDKCGSGKCGGEQKSKCGTSKCGSEKKGKCGTSKCGGEKKSKCGSSKCGGEKKPQKCGSGKCGS
jgi:uncharacterized low-complexity protein